VAHGPRIRFFGHGTRHVNHDALDPDEVRQSVTGCYQAMKRLGLKPVAFAYPVATASFRGHAQRCGTPAS
jgi:hypothetical protein